MDPLLQVHFSHWQIFTFYNDGFAHISDKIQDLFQTRLKYFFAKMKPTLDLKHSLYHVPAYMPGYVSLEPFLCTCATDMLQLMWFENVLCSLSTGLVYQHDQTSPMPINASKSLPVDFACITEKKEAQE